MSVKLIHDQPSLPQHVWWVAVMNVGFTLLAMFHLAYLGLMFGGQADAESDHGTQVKVSRVPRAPQLTFSPLL